MIKDINITESAVWWEKYKHMLREKLTATEKEKIAMVVQMTKMLKSLLLDE